MGKSKYDKLTYTAKLAADKRMAEQVNIDLSQYGNTERPGASYSGKKSWDQLSTDVAEAYSNDYDVRETVKAAQASGNKKAQKLGQGISNASEAYDAQRFMEQTHKTVWAIPATMTVLMTKVMSPSIGQTSCTKVMPLRMT